MATRIRLQRHGRKSYAFYSIVIADSRAPRDGNRIVRRLTEDDFSGVSNLVKSGGCNIAATRDKLAEDETEQNSTDIEVLKCRWSGNTGYAGSWYYDNLTHTLYDKEDFMEKQRSNF
jgi:hypothetical protein